LLLQTKEKRKKRRGLDEMKEGTGRRAVHLAAPSGRILMGQEGEELLDFGSVIRGGRGGGLILRAKKEGKQRLTRLDRPYPYCEGKKELRCSFLFLRLKREKKEIMSKREGKKEESSPCSCRHRRPCQKERKKNNLGYYPSWEKRKRNRR